MKTWYWNEKPYSIPEEHTDNVESNGVFVLLHSCWFWYILSPTSFISLDARYKGSSVVGGMPLLLSHCVRENPVRKVKHVILHRIVSQTSVPHK